MQFILISLLVVIIDQLSKYWTVKNMIEGSSIPVIPGVFYLTFIYNRGAAFGLLENKQWIFILHLLVACFIFVKILLSLTAIQGLERPCYWEVLLAI